jgi:hypothetical protein
MSETNTSASGSRLREWAVFFGWICGLILIGGTAWFLTQPMRDRALMRSVNRVLAQGENPLRLSAPLSAPPRPGAPAPLGSWYALENSGDWFFVFTLIRDGPMALCGARLSSAGRVEEIIPLSAHAAELMKDLPQGMLLTYIHRLEALGIPGAGEKNE